MATGIALSRPLAPLQEGFKTSTITPAKPRFSPANRAILPKDRLLRLIHDDAHFEPAISKLNELLGSCPAGASAGVADGAMLRRVVRESDVQINFYSAVEAPVLLTIKGPSPELRDKLDLNGGDAGGYLFDDVWSFDGKPFLNVEFRME